MLLMTTSSMIDGVSVTSLSLIVVMTILLFLFYVHLNMLWSQGVVVSGMEEGRSGLDALRMAAERHRGMKGVGFKANILVFLLMALAYPFILVAITLLPLPYLVFSILRWLLYPLVMLLIQAINVVFHFECLENQEEEAMRKIY